VTTQSRWLLPDGVDELLPMEAAHLEQLRRIALDLLARWGYQLCMPPIVEFLDSLLSGVGEDLELQTFKLTDQISGRMLGIPADITPQIARIDAHRLPHQGPQRLCYLGPILHTRPDKFAGSRNPLQVGAELYGHAGIEADAEIQSLLLALLDGLGIHDVTLEICHMGIFRGLSAAAKLSSEADSRLLNALLRKDREEVDQTLETAGISGDLADLFRSLLALHGDATVVAEAEVRLHDAPAPVTAAVQALTALVTQLQQRCPLASIHVDLAELRGYHYHTGLMFAAYTRGFGRAVAWGGRYDNVGAYFGRARPATGFSTDLKLLASISALPHKVEPAIFAPAGCAPALLGAIEALRSAGHVVIQALPGQTGDLRAAGCVQQLREVAGSWQLQNL
jgi:ATP phosphoribosyltransferase regulatory subunit